MNRKPSHPVRSVSTEPKPDTPEIQDIDRRRPYSVEPIPLTNEEYEAGNSLRLDNKITPTAKVSAWLETLQDDETEESQIARDGMDTSRPSLLQPINTSVQGQSEGEKLDQLRGKPIPPITSSKAEGPGTSGEGIVGEDDDTSERAYGGVEDIHSSRATIDSETSSSDVANEVGDKNEPADEEDEDRKLDPEKVKKDLIIQVKEAAQPTDNTMTTKQAEIISKLMRRKSSGQNQPDRPPESGESVVGKLSFGGVASTLLQWKIQKARAVKRRAQSIAIDARHFALMGAIADKVKTELPRSLVQSLKEEAHPILVQTVQGYKKEIGKSHRLTMQAQKRLDQLTEELRHLQ